MLHLVCFRLNLKPAQVLQIYVKSLHCLLEYLSDSYFIAKFAKIKFNLEIICTDTEKVIVLQNQRRRSVLYEILL